MLGLNRPLPFFPRAVANSAFSAYLISARGLPRTAFAAADAGVNAGSSPEVPLAPGLKEKQTERMRRCDALVLLTWEEETGVLRCRGLRSGRRRWLTPGRGPRGGRFCCSVTK